VTVSQGTLLDATQLTGVPATRSISTVPLNDDDVVSESMVCRTSAGVINPLPTVTVTGTCSEDDSGSGMPCGSGLLGKLTIALYAPFVRFAALATRR
jgi:hypothetical protein